MTRSFVACALTLCAAVGIGCGGGSLGGSGSGGSSGSGSGGNSGHEDAGSNPGSGGAPDNGTGGSTTTKDAGSTTDSPVMPPPTDGGSSGGGYDSSAADPGTDGDGMRTINQPFKTAPEFNRGGAPAGKVIHFPIGVKSTIYPNAPTSRNIGLYVPSQYKTGTPAPVMVVQDGTDFYGWDSSMPPMLDNLINKGSIPVMVVVFAGNGGGDAVGSERGLEYDTVSGLYAEFVDKELLPRVEEVTKTMLPAQAVTFTHDPEGRAAMGGSSGGAGSFSMAFWHPDLFRRVITFSGTYVTQVPKTSPFPQGCWNYHDYSPYDTTGPNGLVIANCVSAANPTAGVGNPGMCDTPLTQKACEAVTGCMWNTSMNKPIRIWHESGSNDMGAGSGPNGFRDFDLANQRMAAAFAKRGYHYHYDHAIGAGHVDGGAVNQTLPEGLTWLWRGYKATGM